MNIANLKLCKGLYKVSGWKDTYYFYQYREYEDGSSGYYVVNPLLEEPLHSSAYPAYDLGYLLRRLPKIGAVSITSIMGAQWEAMYHGTRGKLYEEKRCQANTPEDAATKLAIELFKYDILRGDN